jgi:hypothetical protein
MPRVRFLLIASALVLAASCAPQQGFVAPAPVEGPGSEVMQGLPFAVPSGALFVARNARASTVYRIRATCGPLHAMNPESVEFFWTLDAAKRRGFKLSDEDGCV